MKPSPLRRITDSPWFWTHAFAAAALAMLLLRGPHVQQRQVWIERNGQFRQRAMLERPADQAKVTLSTAQHTRITLQPLTALLLLVFFGSGAMLWWKRSAHTGPPGPLSLSGDNPTHPKTEGEP